MSQASVNAEMELANKAMQASGLNGLNVTTNAITAVRLRQAEIGDFLCEGSQPLEGERDIHLHRRQAPSGRATILPVAMTF